MSFDKPKERANSKAIKLSKKQRHILLILATEPEPQNIMQIDREVNLFKTPAVQTMWMEFRGLISSEWDSSKPRKRVYRITELGSRCLEGLNHE